MPKWLIGVLAVLVLLAGAVAFVVANLNSYLNDNRDLVSAQVESALGRKVTFGEIGISFSGGLAIRVADLHLSDDPAFSDGDFVTAEYIDVRVAILPALFGNIEVARVVLIAPTVTITQTEEGLSIDSLGGAPADSETAVPTQTNGAATAPALLIALIDVRDGMLRYIDRTTEPASEITIADLDFVASDVSLTDPIDFRLDATLLGANRQNVHVSGTVGPIESEHPNVDLDLEIRIANLENALQISAIAGSLPEGFSGSGEVDIDGNIAGTADSLSFVFELDASGARIAIPDSFRKAKGTPLRLKVEGSKRGEVIDISAFAFSLDRAKLRGSAKITNRDVPEINFVLHSDALPLAVNGAAAADAQPPDVLNDLDLSGRVTLPDAGPNIDAKVRSPNGVIGGIAYQDLAIDLRLRGQKASVSKASLKVFGGGAEVTGSYDMRRATPSFDLEARVMDIRMEQLVPGEKISGGFHANVAVRGSGADWNAIKPNLTGRGDFRLQDGVMKGTNLIDEALSGITGVPGLASLHHRVFARNIRAFSTTLTPSSSVRTGVSTSAAGSCAWTS